MGKPQNDKPQQTQNASAFSAMGGGRMGRGGGGPVSFAEGKAKNAKGTLRQIFAYMRRYPWLLGSVLGATLLISAATVTGPRLIGLAINPYLRDGNMPGLVRILGMLVGVYAVSALASLWQQRSLLQVSNRLLRDLRQDLFAHMGKLPLRVFDQTTHGELMSRLINDVDNVGVAMSSALPQLISSVVTLSATVIMMYSLNAIMATVVLVLTPSVIVISRLIARLARKYFRDRQQTLGEMNGFIEEMVSGARVIKVFGREQPTCEAFREKNERYTRASLFAEISAGMMMPSAHMLNRINFAVMSISGGLMAVNGRLDLGLLTTFLLYAEQFMAPIRNLANEYNNVQSGLAGAERVFEILQLAPEQDSPNAQPMPTPVRGDVRFQGVSFRYQPDKPVLKNISLHAQPGQTIALVGATGSGKTTIINILPRFYNADEGLVTIDGVNIQDIALEQLRSKLGIVLQERHLFTGTVRENIHYGKLEATDEQIERAAKMAYADGFIRRMPKGYDTLLTADGGNLSHGQRQLLGIARAILADAPILILDEATSSVDTLTEVHIQRALLRLMQGRTSFVVAHRLSTIRGADEILVIDKGEIVERGTHQQLLKLGGAYAKLHQHQFAAGQGES